MDQKILSALLRIEQLLVALIEMAADEGHIDDDHGESSEYINAPRK